MCAIPEFLFFIVAFYNGDISETRPLLRLVMTSCCLFALMMNMLFGLLSVVFNEFLSSLLCFAQLTIVLFVLLLLDVMSPRIVVIVCVLRHSFSSCSRLTVQLRE